VKFYRKFQTRSPEEFKHKNFILSTSQMKNLMIFLSARIAILEKRQPLKFPSSNLKIRYVCLALILTIKKTMGRIFLSGILLSINN